MEPTTASPTSTRWTVAIAVPAIIALYGLKKKSLCGSGAVAGMLVGFLLAISSYSFLAAMVSFFLSASRATRYGAKSKKKFEADFKEGGQRNWTQVFCNGGPATFFAVIFLWKVGSVDVPIDFSTSYYASWYSIGVLAAFSCASGDTFASEIGSVAGSTDPFHVVLLKRVPRGTNGGISLIGTLSSLFGGAVVGFAFYVTLSWSAQGVTMTHSPSQWPIILYAALAGGLGSLIDSFLGATLQFSGQHKKLGVIVESRGRDVAHISGLEILDNHSVNFLASILTGCLVPFIAAKTWSSFT